MASYGNPFRIQRRRAVVIAAALIASMSIVISAQPPAPTGATGPAPPSSPTGSPPPATNPAPAPATPPGTPAPTSGPVPVTPPGSTPESVPAASPPPSTPAAEPVAEPPAAAQPPAPSGPREAVVTLKDGQRYTGLLVDQNAERVVLRIAGIDTPIPISLVDRVQVQPPLLEQYRQMRAAIDNNDTERLLVLVEWLRAREQWDLAVAELDHILEVQPDNAEAKKLRLLVESQRELVQKTVPANVHPVLPPDAQHAMDFPLLSDKEINLIKVFEVDLSDPPRLFIDRDTITRLMSEHAGDPLIPKTPKEREAMYRLSPARLLDVMFRLQARDLYSQVKVIDEPRSIRLFRDAVNRSLIANYCATNHCHGGAAAGRLVLTPQRPNSDPSVYTNFLILERFRLRDQSPMIKYDDPAHSPLLQLALPRDMTTVKHPVVPGPEGRGDQWKPFFHGTDDPRFENVVEWIKAMYRPRPDYPVEYRGLTPEPVPSRGPGEPPVIR